MKPRSISRAESERMFQEWQDGKDLEQMLSPEYLAIKSEIWSIYRESEKDTQEWIRKLSRRGKEKSKENSVYIRDVFFGLHLFEYFSAKNWFSLRTAADPGFWRYLSVVAVPDLVKDRWDIHNQDRYYGRLSHIYLYSVWWYVYLSWQQNLDETKRVLLSPNLGTDTMTNLVDRIGTQGTYVDVYRRIIYLFAYLNPFCLVKRSGRELFRAVMKLHMAKTETIIPEFFANGINGYALSLFSELGIQPADFIGEVIKENSDD